MKNLDIIKVNCRLVSYFLAFDIYKGAIFNLEELRHNHLMVKFLCEEHIIDPYCIVGNIGELYRIRDEILRQERIGKMKYRKYLEAKMRGEL